MKGLAGYLSKRALETWRLERSSWEMGNHRPQGQKRHYTRKGSDIVSYPVQRMKGRVSAWLYFTALRPG